MISLFRIDDRLIHGQIMTSWSKVTQARRIIIADDEVIKDQFVCMVMKHAIPKDIKLEILSTDDAIKYLLDNDDEISTIVLVKTSEVAYKLIENGIKVQSLNIGGMGMKPGRKTIYKNIAVSPLELEALNKIQSLGIDVEFKISPGDKGVRLSSL